MKVLFLDVDGVLNCVEDWVEEKTIGHPINEGMNQINRTKVALLQHIINETDCKIVLSSTWRRYFNLEEFHAMLAMRGFLSDSSVFIDSTPEKFTRGEEIQMWLEENGPVESYAILDDNDDMHPSQHLLFVQTEERRGMSYDNALKVVHILGRKK